jgi:RimJ/RimL family protein N-acetyltransferase
MIREAFDADFEAILSGRAPSGLRLPDGPFEAPGVLAMLRDLANGIRPHFAPASWLIVEQGEVVGLCSLVKAPVAGAIQIGYGVTSLRRGNGYAARAVGDLLVWAAADERVRTCEAETSVHNHASQRVLEANGFEQTGTRTDEEDGDLICWTARVGNSFEGH